MRRGSPHMESKDAIHTANRQRWEASAASWGEHADSRGVWRRCPTGPELVLGASELKYLADLRGKRVAVLGSGNNQVVFVLAGMGASVTSVDVAQQQLDIAQRRAREFGLAVEFVRADVTDLAAFANNSFDVVYTGGHVTVWVADLSSYYLAPTAIGRRDAAERAVLETQRVRTQPAIDHARNGRTAVADCVGSPMSPSRW